MLGQPLTMLVPPVVGLRLTGELPRGDDRHRPRPHHRRAPAPSRGGRASSSRSTAQVSPSSPSRTGPPSATWRPEYGATCVIFPIDDVTLDYLALHRSRRGPRGAGRGLRQGTGPVPPGRGTPSRSSPRVGRARPLHGRAEPGRPVAAPGPGVAVGDEGRLPARPGRRRARAPVRRRRAGRPRPRSRTATAPGDRRRSRRDRRHHQLHQHLEPAGDAGGRTPGPEGGGPRTAVQAVGEDLARPRVARRHGLLRAGRAARAARRPRLRAGRLRVHHLHRQLGSPAARRLRGRRARATCRWRPCCRGTGTSRAASTPTSGSTTWPRPPLVVAYALAGHDGPRPHHRAARDRHRRARRSTCATSGRRRPRSPRSSERCGDLGDVPHPLRLGLRRRRALADDRRRRR